MSGVDCTLAFEDGTIRLEGDLASREGIEALPFVEHDPRSGTYRAPAFRYGALRETLDARENDVVDRVLDAPALELASAYELRDYQATALDAWRENDDRGVLELPTGSGKTVIALAAIEALGTSTLVVVPTIDLLEQWRQELDIEFGPQVPDGIGQLGGGIQRPTPLTVSTYDSAYVRADDLGDRFGLVVFDEVHHLGGKGYREIARLLAAPARLGLTATFERPDGAHEAVVKLCGPLVGRVDVEDLAGEHLAEYDLKRIEVELTEAERAEYDDHHGTFVAYLSRSNLDMRSPGDYRKLVMRSGNDPRAREALLAKQRAREVMMSANAKVETLASILDRHRDDRVLVFTAHNDLVYRLSERFLLPAITHQTGAAERRDILEKFRSGEYSRVVASNVLNEGIDVPDANVAVVLSGSGSQREFTQRLGRVLRPGEGKRALLYEVITTETAEERIADRRH